MKKIDSDLVIQEICNAEEPIMIYGAGHYGHVFQEYLSEFYDRESEGYLVSSEQLLTTSQVHEECQICSIEEVQSDRTKVQLIIAISEQHQSELIQNAVEQGFVNIYIILNEMVRYMERCLKADRLLPLKKFNFEVHITEHCNLNCKGCYHFSPLAKEEYLSLDEFKQDMKRLYELFGTNISSITLLGGEPLLHPEVTKFFDTIRMFLVDTQIILLTNGILLTKMEDAFWRSCSDNHISVFCTKYPVIVDYASVERKAKQFGLTISYHNDVNAGEKTLIKYPFDITGKQSQEWNYEHCTRSNQCITLKHGKIYTCPMAAHAHLAKEFFDLNLELSDKDYIDIYTVEKASDITEFLTHSIPFCRYCNLRTRPEQSEWSVSKKQYQEWF